MLAVSQNRTPSFVRQGMYMYLQPYHQLVHNDKIVLTIHSVILLSAEVLFNLKLFVFSQNPKGIENSNL